MSLKHYALILSEGVGRQCLPESTLSKDPAISPHSDSMKRLCVLSDFSGDANRDLEDSAINLAIAMAEARIGLVCQGGSNGLTRLIAETVKRRRGHVTSVALHSRGGVRDRFDKADELILQNSLHECKRALYEISDAFAVLPGGVGTLEVLMEYLTWMQRGRQRKPVYIINFHGYWDPLFQVFDHMDQELFLPVDFGIRYIRSDDGIDAVTHFCRLNGYPVAP
jgi:uncharacterized protein (TIGR00730 family)